jgi:hypothetical protein
MEIEATSGRVGTRRKTLRRSAGKNFMADHERRP